MSVSDPAYRPTAAAVPAGYDNLPLALSNPVTATVESNVAALVTSNVPGTSTLLVNSTPDPPESVCNN